MFAQARDTPSLPDADFMARLMADAEALQPAPRGLVDPKSAAAVAPRRGILSRLIAVLGGAGAVAGIGSAAMAGLVIGYVQPDPLVSLTDGFGLVAVSESLDLLPSFDTLLTEE